jgi:saccharopine dehydrogenase-like NADP-dependent oxidoreductase
MIRAVIYGAGRLGKHLAQLLVADATHQVVLLDQSEEALDAACANVSKVVVAGISNLNSILKSGDVLVATAASDECLPLASAALRNRCHYLDFHESISTAKAILELEPNGTSTLIPSCGFSPGLLSALIADFAAPLKGTFDLYVYTGVLPTTKSNRLGYGLVANVEGLLEEYLGTAAIKQDGEWRQIEALSLEETIVVDGERLEAFVTGGTTNELPHSVAEKVNNYAYRTLRYPGHLDYIHFLLDDLKLRKRRDRLSSLLRNGLPGVEHDQVIIHLNATAFSSSRRDDFRRTWRISGSRSEGGVLYDIAARHGAAVIDLLADGHLDCRGSMRQEDIDPGLILSNPHVRVLFEKQ